MNAAASQGQANILEALPEASVLVTGEGMICAANGAFRRMVGKTNPMLLERPLAELVSDPTDKLDNYLQRCARSRQPVLGTLAFQTALADEPQSFRCEGAVVQPWTPAAPALILLRLRPREAVVERFVLLERTIDELHQEVRERRQVEARLRLLAEVSSALSTSLDHITILQQVVELVVGHYADWCMVYLLEQGELARVATAHVDPAKMDLARRLSRRSPRYTVPAPFVRVVEKNEPLFCPEYDEAVVLAGINDADQIATIRRINPQSVIAVPLHARGTTLGVLAFVWSESDRRYSQSDLSFAGELARRTALVVENARLYQDARAAEAQLRQFNQTLESVVAERTAELERSNDELDQFAHIASHDLKAPLRAINHLANWVADDAGDALPEVAVGHLAKLRQRVARMERLLNDLLAYSRAGREYHAPENVDCVLLVHNVVELISLPPGFVVTADETLPYLYTERVPLETVLRNLISNAIKHHHNPSAGRVCVTAHTTATMTEFAVHDNGPGIDPAHHGRIFEAFQALNPRDQIEGSGIGLAVVKKMVERRGGSARVESQEGSGAVFYFTWPSAPKSS